MSATALFASVKRPSRSLAKMRLGSVSITCLRNARSRLRISASRLRSVRSTIDTSAAMPSEPSMEVTPSASGNCVPSLRLPETSSPAMARSLAAPLSPSRCAPGMSDSMAACARSSGEQPKIRAARAFARTMRPAASTITRPLDAASSTSRKRSWALIHRAPTFDPSVTSTSAEAIAYAYADPRTCDWRDAPSATRPSAATRLAPPSIARRRSLALPRRQHARAASPM